LPDSAVLRLAVLRANQITSRTFGTFTLHDLQVAHEWAWNAVRKLMQEQPHLTAEEAALQLIERMK